MSGPVGGPGRQSHIEQIAGPDEKQAATGAQNEEQAAPTQRRSRGDARVAQDAGAAVQASRLERTLSGQPQRSEARKTFWHSPYTNADAGVVKKELKLPTLDAAKEHIGNAILTGKEGEQQKIGVSRWLLDDQDCISRFQRSQFTDADVKQAKKSFSFLKDATTTEVKAYLGLKLRNAESYGFKDGVEMLKQHGITESKYDDHEMMASFKRSGMPDKHVNAARDKFDFLGTSSVKDIKEYLGLKVLAAKDGLDFAKDFLKQIGA